MTIAIMVATGFFLLPPDFVAAEAPAPSGESATVLALIALAGTILAAVIGGIFLYRSNVGRKYSDTRDDKTAEVQDLKTIVDAAVLMSKQAGENATQARENAQASIEGMKATLDLAKSQLESANATIVSQQVTITTLQHVITDLQSGAASVRAEAEEQLLALEADLQIKTGERDQFAHRVRELEQHLAVSEARQVELETVGTIHPPLHLVGDDTETERA